MARKPAAERRRESSCPSGSGVAQLTRLEELGLPAEGVPALPDRRDGVVHQPEPDEDRRVAGAAQQRQGEGEARQRKSSEGRRLLPRRREPQQARGAHEGGPGVGQGAVAADAQVVAQLGHVGARGEQALVAEQRGVLVQRDEEGRGVDSAQAAQEGDAAQPPAPGPQRRRGLLGGRPPPPHHEPPHQPGHDEGRQHAAHVHRLRPHTNRPKRIAQRGRQRRGVEKGPLAQRLRHGRPAGRGGCVEGGGGTAEPHLVVLPEARGEPVGRGAAVAGPPRAEGLHAPGARGPPLENR